LNGYADDICTWANDLYSFNYEQSQGETENFVLVAMKELGLDVQGGVDYVGDRIKGAIDKYLATKASLPSWSPEIDRQVAIYACSLENTFSSNAHWSLTGFRYFGEESAEVSRTLWVNLWPKKVLTPEQARL